MVTDPPAGKYVARIVYYASPANDWTRDRRAALRQATDVQKTGKTEAYTLTCETGDGKVLGEPRRSTVRRGEHLALALPAGCGGAQPAADVSGPSTDGAGGRPPARRGAAPSKPRARPARAACASGSRRGATASGRTGSA